MPTLRQSLVAAVTRRYPFYSGRGSLASHPLLQRLAGPSSELAWGRVFGGNLAPAPLDDYVGRAIYYFGDLDKKITWVCRRMIRPGDTVLDIGANVGSVTCVMSALVGKTGRVHSFEPNPERLKLLDLAIEKNHLSNVTVHRMALGAESGKLELSIPRGNSGRATLAPVRQEAGDVKISVPVERLSSVLSGEKIDRIRLVKIDVEGFEAEVLQGAVEFFSRNPPDAILFELNDPDGPTGEHPTLKILGQLGYRFFSIPKCMCRMRLKRFDPAITGGAAPAHDFLAARQGEVEEEIAKLTGA